MPGYTGSVNHTERHHSILPLNACRNANPVNPGPKAPVKQDICSNTTQHMFASSLLTPGFTECCMLAVAVLSLGL